MTVNQDENGIRYGLVSMRSLQDWVWDEFFSHGENISHAEYLKDKTKELRAEWRDNDNGEQDDFDDIDEYVDYRLENDDYYGEEDVYTLTRDGMQLQITWLGGSPNVWVFKSPHITRARLCGPCVPNAGNLDCIDAEGYETYTLPAQWFANYEGQN